MPFEELGALPRRAAAPPVRDSALASLGARLFFDPRLSSDGRVSCASCHRPEQGWTVRSAVGSGVQGRVGRRNPPALLGVAAELQWGWDGHGRSLEAQSVRPLTDFLEMGHASPRDLVRHLQTLPDLADRLTVWSERSETWPDVLGAALVAFQRGLQHVSRFDRFVTGDHQALSDVEVRGLHLFRTHARCANCHFGPRFSDGGFHNLGIAFYGEPKQDLGRYGVSLQCEDAGRFRTPTLRSVALTAPYMHHGLFANLEGVVRLYVRGGGDPRIRNAVEAADPLRRCAARVSSHLKPLSLTEADVQALIAFLRTL
ncbi:c-type cytochrome [Aquabacterium sp. A08]|nr:c-type cytochrome [Aquabacterium sp. A08]